MTTEEAIQRGNNLAGVAIAALAGIAYFPEFFLETEGPFKLDEVGLLLVGLVGIAWYFIGTQRLRRSLVPVVLLAGDVVFKIIGLVLEVGDTEDVGDEYAALILFALAAILAAWLYISSRRNASASAG